MTAGVRAIRRIVSEDKLVPSWTLNRLGAQVVRTVAARALYNIRRVAGADMVARELAELQRDGIIVIQDFLRPEHFDLVRRESAWLETQRAHATRTMSGSTCVETTAVGTYSQTDLAATCRFFDDPRMRALVSAAERRPFGPLALSGEHERVVQGPAGGEPDPETELHSDIFFSTHKAWLYLDDVQPADGPLVYVKGSHRVTPARLGFIYRDSWMRDPSSNPSRRIAAEEQAAFRVQETIVTCAANTLVLINACGYHRRLSGEPGRTRRALHLSVRANPFMPYGLHSRIAGHPALYRFLRRTIAGRRR